MWKILVNRLQQGFRTLPYPGDAPDFPARFRGRPVIAAPDVLSVDKTKDPLGVLADGKAPAVDMGKCLFNEDLAAAGMLTYSRDHRMAVSRREDLLVTGDGVNLAGALQEKTRRIFGRSLKLREVCAGSCNGCDAEIQATGNVVFDLSRFGIQFVASPRHADGLMVTGPVTRNMELALRKTYEAVPHPKIVIAVGACAISGGPFQGGREIHNGVDGIIPVDLFVPGCPPHPLTILDGLLRLLGRLETDPDRRAR